MGSTLLVGMESRVRADLMDLDSSNYLWPTAILDRHLQHAVSDYSRVLPLEAFVVFLVAATPSQGPNTPITLRQIFNPPPGYLWAMRLEYPIDQHPPMYRTFREEYPQLGSIFLSAGDAPNVGDAMKMWYAASHVLSATASTILQEHEELVSLGAVAYAATAATRFTASRQNATSWTPRGIAAFAQDRMKAYTAWLEQLRSSYSSEAQPWVQWGQWPWDWNRV